MAKKSKANNVTARADAYWTKLVRQIGDHIDIDLCDDGKPLGAIDKGGLLWYRLIDRYFDKGDKGTVWAMKAVDKYFAATGIGAHPQAKHIRCLFEEAISLAANEGPMRDNVMPLCNLVAVWAESKGLAQTTVRVQTDH